MTVSAATMNALPNRWGVLRLGLGLFAHSVKPTAPVIRQTLLFDLRKSPIVVFLHLEHPLPPLACEVLRCPGNHGKEGIEMATLEISVDDELLRRAEKFAASNGTTIEVLIVDHLTGLVGRRRTVREQIYRDYEPPAEVVERLQTEWLGETTKD